MRVWIDSDETYLTYITDKQEQYPDGRDRYTESIELSQEELEDYQRVTREYHEWQMKLMEKQVEDLEHTWRVK